MFRKISLTALALASAVALAPNANASTATATVSFSGTVASSCSFGTVTNGTLGSAVLNAGNYNMGWNAGAGPTNSIGYTSGSVSLNCNTSAAITVGNLTNNGSTGTTPTQSISPIRINAGVNGGAQYCFNPGYTSVQNTCTLNAYDNPTIAVDMRLGFGTTNPTAGSYNYSTTLTATYN